jgi:hypothetical protein
VEFIKPHGALDHSDLLSQTSRNLPTITRWNSLVDTFAGKEVQFLFISGEKESTLLPWLSQHPIKGWVFHDPNGETGRAYGLEEPATVFIGTDGKIIGFGDMGFPPQELQVTAALEGRITTTRPTPATMKVFLESGQVVLNAEPFRMLRADEHKPNFPPSYTLHVSPSKGEDVVTSPETASRLCVATRSKRRSPTSTVSAQFESIFPILLTIEAVMNSPWCCPSRKTRAS